MKTKTIFAYLFLLAMVLGMVWSFSLLRKKTNNGLIIIGKAPSFSLINQHNQPITNENYKGKVFVVDFFFTTCLSICPIMSHNMVKVQNAFPDNSIGIASFTIDPETDTPSVLQTYAKQYGVTNPDWNFLTGNPSVIYDLANNGFNLHAKEGNLPADFEHSGLFALIDQAGNIVSRTNEKGEPIVYYNGLLQEEIEMLIEDIKKLQSK